MKQQSKWAILGGVILAMLLSSLDQTIVATAMPKIVQELNGLEHLSWVFTAYMLGSTVTVPIYGKLSDTFGRRGLYLLGIVIFLTGSALCGMANNMSQLIFFRGLQGIGGGAMMVNSFAIIGEVFPPAERGKYQGLLGGVFGLSSVGGPLLGGWITDNFTWRWVFYVNLPLGILALIVLSGVLPKITQHVKNRNIDFLGAFFIITTLIPLLLALVWAGSIYAWGSWQIIVALAIAAASLIAFIVTEKRVRNPVLSLSLFKNKVFVVSVMATFLTAMGMFGAIIYIPIFAQGIIGVSATNSGLILTPMMISLVVASAISGIIITRTGKYKVLAIVGTAITVLGLYFFSWININTSNIELVLHMIILGIGLGVTMPIFTVTVQSAFGKERLGEVTAGSQLFRSIGGTVGTAILGGIMNSRLATEMQGLQHEPFVVLMQKFNPGKAQQLNGNVIQSVLNPDNQAHIKTLLTQIPPEQRAAASGSFDEFLEAAKTAFSHAVDNVFLIGSLLMVAALIVVFFLPEIPLRKSDRPVSEDVGITLEQEWGHADDENQPKAKLLNRQLGINDPLNERHVET